MSDQQRAGDIPAVRRFDSESWVMVYCRPNSNVVQMMSNIADEHVARMYADSLIADDGYVFRICKAGVLIAALELIKGKEPQ